VWWVVQSSWFFSHVFVLPRKPKLKKEGLILWRRKWAWCEKNRKLGALPAYCLNLASVQMPRCHRLFWIIRSVADKGKRCKSSVRRTENFYRRVDKHGRSVENEESGEASRWSGGSGEKRRLLQTGGVPLRTDTWRLENKDDRETRFIPRHACWEVFCDRYLLPLREGFKRTPAFRSDARSSNLRIFDRWKWHIRGNGDFDRFKCW